MRLENKQYEEIKQTVIDIFEEYDVKSIPISAFEIAVKMGLRVIPYSSLSKKRKLAAKKISLDGFSIELQSGEWLIHYNDNCNYGRINHTIMHEIGHYSLGHLKGGDIEEAEAKFFAKYALAPPPLIHSLEHISPKSIKKVFDISYQASCYAYNYYQAWLNCGQHSYTDYEIKLLELFKTA